MMMDNSVFDRIVNPKLTSKGYDGLEAFYMVGRPVQRVYESDLSAAYRGGSEKAGKLLKELQRWRVWFLKGNR